MSESILRRLSAVAQAVDPEVLRGTRIGLEKESLRVATSGGISMAEHPRAWGAALTHPWLTTDYSEALAEFITPAQANAAEALDFLADLQSYAYRRLDREILWATSMPCVLYGDENIPLAKYGDSNLGRMKHIYRVGLGYRYGRVMQVIAGVHFNWSLPDLFWEQYQPLSGTDLHALTLRDVSYMGLVRNLLRASWLVPYLFGASPAVCRSFFRNGESKLVLFDDATFYEPYATSLRMGDIGYQNSREEGLGIRVCYDSAGSYAESLLRAVTTPAEAWQRIGVQVDDEYRQLSANLLQIENEYYSSVRPKPYLDKMESPAVALKRRGVRYLELRSLDVNAYHPLGVDEQQLHFLEAWMLTCLLEPSPGLCLNEQHELNRNLLDVAHRGREPGLQLSRNGQAIALKDWAGEILADMQPVCEMLDQLNGVTLYAEALQAQIDKVRDPELTPSARMLAEMRENGEGFFQFAQRLSVQHHNYFIQRELNAERNAEFDRLAQQSHEQQAQIEAQPQQDFDEFLKDYFRQTYLALEP